MQKSTRRSVLLSVSLTFSKEVQWGVRSAESLPTAHSTLPTPHSPLAASLAGHRRFEDLVVVARVTTADSRSATDDPDQIVFINRSVDAVNRNRHVLEARPLVVSRIVVLMVGRHAAHVLSTPDVVATPGHDRVHSAAAAQHGRRSSPRAGLWIENFVRRRFFDRQTRAKAATNDVDAAVDDGTGHVIALRRQAGQSLPGIGRGVVDGEVVSARRASTSDIDFPLVNDGDTGAARGGHL